MCLTIPMKVEEIAKGRVRCTALGVERWADLTLMAETLPKVGEYVAIHLGFVQRIVSQKAALEAQALFSDIIASQERLAPESD